MDKYFRFERYLNTKIEDEFELSLIYGKEFYEIVDWWINHFKEENL